MLLSDFIGLKVQEIRRLEEEVEKLIVLNIKYPNALEIDARSSYIYSKKANPIAECCEYLYLERYNHGEIYVKPYVNESCGRIYTDPISFLIGFETRDMEYKWIPDIEIKLEANNISSKVIRSINNWKDKKWKSMKCVDDLWE